MRARPNPSGEQLVTEYLARVAQEARLLPKGARMAFVGRTKALIERELGPRTRTEPEQVLALLDRLGPPEDLVRDERTRIDRRWVKSRAASKEEGEAAAAALTEPLNRSLPSRRRLNTDTWPFGRPAQAEPEPGTGLSAASEGAGPRRSGLGSGGPRSTGLRGVGPRSASPRGASPRSASPRSDATRNGGLRSAGPPGAGAPPQDAPPQDAPPRGTGPAGTGRTGRLGRLARKGTGTRGQRRNEALADAWQLARDNLRESIAILLLGLGGLILPFPFWPIGAVVAMFSRLWDVKDKLLAVTGPLLVALAGSVLTAPFIGGSGNIILVYTHALGAGFGLMIRVGSVLTAAYLAWRVSRGPRIKVPPWKRITR